MDATALLLTTSMRDFAIAAGLATSAFGPAAAANVLNNGDALALLIGGILCSVVLGLLVDLLGAARWSTPKKCPRSISNRPRRPALARPDHEELPLCRRIFCRSGWARVK